MTQPLKKRSEGRKKWEKGLDNSGNIEIPFSECPDVPVAQG
jgi:hypothetical protein